MKYFCYHPGPNLDTLHWMLQRKIKWWGMDTGSCDHAMNTSIRNMRPDLAEEFTKKHGETPGEFFGTFEFTHKKSGRRVTQDVFPFHSWAFQEGLLHAENLGGDIELMLGKRCLIGAFPWRYEGLEGCPCRIVCFLDAGSRSKRSATRRRRSCGADVMPHITARDGVRLYYEEAGTGSAIVFVHEYAGDWRSWEPQMRHFSRSHRCVTYSQRGYPPSDVPKDAVQYGQYIARDDVIALMDGLKIDKAHIVGHSMGAATALHVGIHLPAAVFP